MNRQPHKVGEAVALLINQEVVDGGDRVWDAPGSVFVRVDRVARLGDGRHRYSGWYGRSIEWTSDDEADA